MMDGTVHDDSETLDEHLNGECQQCPYSGPPLDDLGTGEAWFMAQDDAIQQAILGPAAWSAWDQGDVQLADLVSHEGGYAHEASLKSLGIDYRQYLKSTPSFKQIAENVANLPILKAPELAEVPVAEEELMLAAKAKAPSLPQIPQTPEAQLADLQAQRDVFSAQKDVVQAKLDTLSTKWGNLVLKEADLDPEEDEDEIAKMETQIASVEKQQATQMAKMDALDAKISDIDAKITELSMPPDEKIAAAQAKLDSLKQQAKDLQAQRNQLLNEQNLLVQQELPYQPELQRAEYQAKQDIYLEQRAAQDPQFAKALQQYRKDEEKYQQMQPAVDQARADMDAAKAHADDVGAKVTWSQGPAPNFKSIKPWGPKTIPADATDEQIQAWKDYRAAEAASAKVYNASSALYGQDVQLGGWCRHHELGCWI